MLRDKRKVVFLIFIFAFTLNCKTISQLTAKNGSEFIVQVETNEPNKDEIFQQAIDKLKKEANSLGLIAEINPISDKPYQLNVKIYAPEDIEKAKKTLFTNYQLELRKVISPPNPNSLQQFPTAEAAKQKATALQEILPFRDKNAEAETFVIVDIESIITGRDLRLATATNGQNVGVDYAVWFSLNPAGAAKFGDWTSQNINNYLAIVLNKNVVSIAYIKTQITDRGQIDGKFTKEEAENIALSLNNGHLPANFKVLSENVFGK